MDAGPGASDLALSLGEALSIAPAGMLGWIDRPIPKMSSTRP